jgi:hypothetical protein
MYVQETPEYFRLKHFLDFASHHSIKEMQPVAKNCQAKDSDWGNSSLRILDGKSKGLRPPEKHQVGFRLTGHRGGSL